MARKTPEEKAAAKAERKAKKDQAAADAKTAAEAAGNDDGAASQADESKAPGDAHENAHENSNETKTGDGDDDKAENGGDGSEHGDAHETAHKEGGMDAVADVIDVDELPDVGEEVLAHVNLNGIPTPIRGKVAKVLEGGSIDLRTEHPGAPKLIRDVKPLHTIQIGGRAERSPCGWEFLPDPEPEETEE